MVTIFFIMLAKMLEFLLLPYAVAVPLWTWTLGLGVSVVYDCIVFYTIYKTVNDIFEREIQ